MDTGCVCDPKDEDEEFDTAKEESETTISVIINEIFDFGKVSPGKKVYKVFEIENTLPTTQEYLVQFDPDINPIYRPFDFTWNRTVDAGYSLQCKISYKPIFASSVDVDYLYIHEASGELYTLSLRGESMGPKVEISTTYLTFYAISGIKTVEHIIELSNKGNAEAIYQFDVTNNKTGLFSLSKNRGTIPVNKQHYVTITFASKEQGIYCEALPILILHHKPRIIQLVGIHVSGEVSDLLIKHYNFDVAEKDDYTGYLYDVMTVLKYPPPFSLSDVYLTFDGIDLESNNGASKTLVTSLSNHMSEEIEVEWYEDTSTCFTIMPKTAKISPYNSCLFECKFTPPIADQLYYQVLGGGAYWIDTRKSDNCGSYANAPIPTHLRLFGHSFPCNKRWIPQLTMPETIIVPPCLPKCKSVTTFLLKLNGYLPVGFRFMPPKNSKFIIKPMMGVVSDYQIVVAFLQCGWENKKAYVERWGVELNGMAQMRSIFLKGYCESPSVKIGADNTIRFQPVHPYCQEREVVQIHNDSVHCLKYKFNLDKVQEVLKVNYPEGTLSSNEIINLEWTYTGQPPSIKVYTVTCELRILFNGETIGEPYEIRIKIHTKCEYSELCSMPNKCNFRKLEVGAQHTFRFNLFNFGSSPVHYKLVFWDKRRGDFDDKYLSVVPSHGTLETKQRNEILLCLRCDLVGSFNVVIYYQTRMSKDSAQIINSNELNKIFSFKFTSVYPVIQIVDISHHSFGPLFSKTALWDIFNIYRINHFLRTMTMNQTKSVNVFLPESVGKDEIFKTAWLLQNNSLFDTRLSIKRNKVCDCPLIQKSKSFTFRAKSFDCKHRSLFSMSLSGEIFQANARQTLDITVQYQEIGHVLMSYTFTLSHSRTLTWNIYLNTLPEDIIYPSKYLSEFNIKLGVIRVNDEEPPVQAFWLYNNSGNDVAYKLNIASAYDSIYVREFPVLRCFNPEGSISPYTAAPILFKFCPIQYKAYKFSFPIILGENSYQFNLSGFGNVKSRKKLFSTLPQIQTRPNPLNQIYLSDEYIKVRPFSVWSKTEVAIFIKNLSQDNIIGYSFQRSLIEGIVEIKAAYAKGVLRPKESHMVKIEILSFDQPCKIRMHFTCKLLNHTEYYKYRQTLLLHSLRQQEIKDEFIITEKGTQYPPNEVTVKPMPHNFFKTISLDIKIISIADIDKFLDSEDQLTQLPQFMLSLDSDKITKALMAKQVEQPIRSSYVDKLKTEATDKSRIREDIENVGLVRDAMDCIITNALNANIFHKILMERRDQIPPYYIQIRSGESKSSTFEKLQRERLLEESFTSIQAPLITEIFQRLITESIHEVFHLGCQSKTKIDISYVYNNAFRCQHCIRKTCME